MLTPREYQLRAIEAALPHDGFALFMQQRTGKTYASLWIRERWGCVKTLVICPKKAVPVWRDSILALSGNTRDFTIVTFEYFRIHFLDYLTPWDLIIIDESHRIKERGSVQTQRCWKVGKFAIKRLILSGSPQGQGLEDYYSQLRFIRPDLYPSWKDFSERFIVMGKVWFRGLDEDPIDKIVGYRNEEEFKIGLRAISYRVTRDEVSKIKTVVRNKKVLVSPSREFIDLYNHLSNELFLDLEGSMVSAPHVLVKAIKLHQLCGGFLKDNEGRVNHLTSDKMNTLLDLLDGELKGVPLVIVAQYKAELDYISQELLRRKIPHAQVRGKHQYDPQDRSHITLLHPSAGESINLSHYNVMVVYSMSHSYLKWEQFKDRIVLVDTPVVKYYYLTCPGTMDEIVYESVVKKKKLSESVMEIYNRVGFGYNELSAEKKAEILKQTQRKPTMKKTKSAAEASAATTESNIDQTNAGQTPARALDIITLAEICQELSTKPQAARVKLRRELPKAKSEPGFRWVFPLADKQKIIDLLQKPEAKAPEAAPAAEGSDATDTGAEDEAPSSAGEPVAEEPLPAE